MLLRKRRLNKEDPFYKIKIIFLTLLFISSVVIGFSYLYINNYFTGYNYINPLSINRNSSQYLFKEKLEKSNLGFTKIVINKDDSISATLKSGGSVIFSSKKDLSSQITSLQLILSRLTIEGKKLKTLDFRFDNPVVSFN